MGKVLQFTARETVHCRKCGRVGIDVRQEKAGETPQRMGKVKRKHFTYYVSGWEEVRVIERKLPKVRNSDYWHTPYYNCPNCREHKPHALIQLYAMFKRGEITLQT